MIDDTTDGTQPSEEYFQVRGPQPDGWTILYNHAIDLLLPEHSAVVRCYLALCKLSNGQRSAHPSLTYIGKAMGDMSRDSAKRAVKRLEEIGLLVVERPENQGRGMASIYHLTTPDQKGGTHAPLSEKGGTGAPKGVQAGAKRGAAAMPPQQVSNKQPENKKAPLNPPREKVAATDDQPMVNATTSVATANEKGSVSNHVGTEDQHPYWTDGELAADRLFIFNQIFEWYPKKDSKLRAMAVWREVIGTELDNCDVTLHPTAVAIARGVQQYARDQKGQEVRYITSLHNWLAERRWLDGVREQ